MANPHVVPLVFVVPENGNLPSDHPDNKPVRIEANVGIGALAKILDSLRGHDGKKGHVDNRTLDVIAKHRGKPLIISDRTILSMPINYVSFDSAVLSTPSATFLCSVITKQNLDAPHAALTDLSAAANFFNGVQESIGVGAALSLIPSLSWNLNNGLRSDGRPNGVGAPHLRTGPLSPDFMEAMETVYLRAGVPVERADKNGTSFLVLRQAALVEAIQDGKITSDSLRFMSNDVQNNCAGILSSRQDIRAGLTVLNDMTPQILAPERVLARWTFDRGIGESEPVLRLDKLPTHEQAGKVREALRKAGVRTEEDKTRGGSPLVIIRGWSNIAGIAQYPKRVAQDIEQGLSKPGARGGGGFGGSKATRKPEVA